jgi:glycosyltransferase involved in cell wall biosynthesis
LKLLIFTDWFTPGYKAGGPVRSLLNLTRVLQEEVDIYVFTSNKDLGAKEPYPDIPANEWVTFEGKIRVFYSSRKRQRLRAIRRILLEVEPEVIYLNSMFSPVFTLRPLWLAWRGKVMQRIVLAPRGMLRKSALQFKRWKKKPFLQLFRLSGLHRRICFHATDEQEKIDVQKCFGKEVEVKQLFNFPVSVGKYVEKETPSGAGYRFIFVGRLHPIKGLHQALAYLLEVNAPLQLSIVGALEKAAYWRQCQEIMGILPGHIRVDYLGELPPSELEAQLRQHHFFILPTQGENFGHAIFEALAAGLPALISDQTPWRDLETQKAGFDLPLDDPQNFIHHIEMAANMDFKEYRQWSCSAWQFASGHVHSSDLKQQYLELFVNG